MKKLKQLLCRIGCACGNHTYSPIMDKFTFIDKHRKFATYRVENDCVHCGKHYCALIEIPLPITEHEEKYMFTIGRRNAGKIEHIKNQIELLQAEMDFLLDN